MALLTDLSGNVFAQKKSPPVGVSLNGFVALQLTDVDLLGLVADADCVHAGMRQCYVEVCCIDIADRGYVYVCSR